MAQAEFQVQKMALHTKRTELFRLTRKAARLIAKHDTKKENIVFNSNEKKYNE